MAEEALEEGEGATGVGGLATPTSGGELRGSVLMMVATDRTEEAIRILPPFVGR